MRHGNFEVTIFGGTRRRYRRWHDTFDEAKETALRVLRGIDMRPDRFHFEIPGGTALIYGPDGERPVAVRRSEAEIEAAIRRRERHDRPSVRRHPSTHPR